MPPAMIGSMSRAAWSAWRTFLFAITPCLWFGTAVIHPYGFTGAATMSPRLLIPSYLSWLMLFAKWYSAVSTPARRTATSGTGMNRISSR